MPRRHRKGKDNGATPLVRPLAFSRGQSPNRGHSPKSYFLRYGGAQPRLTSGGVADSGGEAAMKIAEGRRRKTATVKTSA